VTLTSLKLDGQLRTRTIVLLTTIVTVVFAGLMTLFSVEVFFFLYYANFLGVVVCIPCLTYLINELLPGNKRSWTRLIGLGLVSTVATMVIAGFLILNSFMHNPMDPAIQNEATEERND